MKNTQAIEKQVSADDNVLAVNSIFHTIQGEGPFAGKPAIFIRLAGCNLQCPLCDTEYTAREMLGPNRIMARVNRAHGVEIRRPADLVVITGGEPFRQNLAPLIYTLRHAGYDVQIETNGTLAPINELSFPYSLVTIVCSPKTGKVNALLLPHIAAFKYVATAGSLFMSHDGLPMSALDHPNSPTLYRKLPSHPAEVYLQPVDEQDEDRNAANLAAVVRSCQVYNHRLCLQIHKTIGVP